MRLLGGLDAQRFRSVPTPSIRVIVVDNAPAAEAADACNARSWTWPVQFLHEPRPGISFARNTALAAVAPGTDFIAMIDDDEMPAPDWLEQLLVAQARTAADIVVGPSLPEFSQDTPAWVSDCGFFLKPQNARELPDLHPDPPAATCNVLVRAPLLGAAGRDFDPALARSGGEDKLLFQSLKLDGCRFAWAAHARVSEWIPPERANLDYMWREAYRRGCVKFYVKRRLKARSAARAAGMALRMSLRSVARVAIDLLQVLARLRGGRAAWVPHALAVADSLGTIAGILHIPNRHYRPAEPK